MFCTKCGAEHPDSSAFCPRCGNPTGNKPVNSAPITQPVNSIPNAQPVNNIPDAQPVNNIPGNPPAQQQNYTQQRTNYPAFNPNINAVFFANQVISEANSINTLALISIIAAFVMPLAGFICGLMASSKIKKLPFVNEFELNEVLRFQYTDAKNKIESSKKLANLGWILSLVFWLGSFILGIILGVIMVASEMYYF